VGRGAANPKVWFQRVVATLVLGCLPFACAALDPKRAIDHYALDVWREGLPQPTVQALHQDRDGYMWLGTFEGLVRFNGVRFDVFDQRNVPQVDAWHVRALAESPDGTLWIGTLGNGLVRARAGEFVALTARDGLPDDFINDLHVARDGSLWIATRAGLGRLRDGKFSAWHVADGLPNDDVAAVVEEADGRIAVGTAGGLVRFDSRRFEPLLAGSTPSGVASLGTSRDGSLWVGTYNDGLFRLAGEAMTHWDEANGLPGGWVTSVLEDARGTLWVTTAPGGVSRLRDGRFELLARKDGLPSDSVRTMATDREGSLWIGTNAGLARLKDLKFVTISRRNGLPEDQVRVVLQSRDGALWLGTYGAGLVRWKDHRFTLFGSPDGWKDAYIRTLAEGRDGTIWVGTQTGLNRIVDGHLESMSGRDGLVGTKVDAIAELADGTLLVNTETGGLQARPRGGTFAPFVPAAAQELHGTRVIVQGRDGKLWLGTSESGVFEVDGVRILRRFQQPDGLPDDAVLAMHMDADGTLWIGTHKGLARLRNGRLAVFPAGSGPGDDPVFQVLDDGRGTLWLTTPHALVAMPRAAAEAKLDGAGGAVPVRRYGRVDGLGSDLGSGGTQPAAAMLADGMLAIPTVGGLALVDPSDLHENRVPPKTVLTDVLIDGRTASHATAVAPPWSSQRFEFRFDGLSLLVPEAVGFRYRLDGFDAGWIDGGNARSAHYTALPAGHYRFRVQARNNDGVWSRRAAEHSFDITAPLWLRWWALAAYGLAALYAVYSLVRWRERALVVRNLSLERAVHARTAELTESNLRLRDTTEQLAAANARLEHLAVTDSLTGLANRRRFDEVLANEWMRARRTGQPLALLLLDVDHFKKFNDAYGHPEGDECLRAIANALRATTRRSDLAARYGGEEFALVCPETTTDEAFALAQHVLAAVRALRLPHATSPVAPLVTVSIGVAGTGTSCPDPEALVAAADAALYDAKRNGRDRASGPGTASPARSDEAPSRG